MDRLDDYSNCVANKNIYFIVVTVSVDIEREKTRPPTKKKSEERKPAKQREREREREREIFQTIDLEFPFECKDNIIESQYILLNVIIERWARNEIIRT